MSRKRLKIKAREFYEVDHSECVRSNALKYFFKIFKLSVYLTSHPLLNEMRVGDDVYKSMELDVIDASEGAE